MIIWNQGVQFLISLSVNIIKLFNPNINSKDREDLVNNRFGAAVFLFGVFVFSQEVDLSSVLKASSS
jgi:hypothetical protein